MLFLRSIFYILLNKMSSDALSVQPSLHIKRLTDVEGLEGMKNDVIYHPANDNKHPISRVMFFGGDVQDYPENMVAHRDNKRYLKWNLENTATIIHSHFPHSEIFVIRPLRMHIKTFSCYDNFVSGNDVGAPKHLASTRSLRHLKMLLQSAVAAAKSFTSQDQLNDCPSSECTSNFLPDQRTYCDGQVSDVPLILIGFSKGCVVLNQLLYSFQALAQSKEEELEDFAHSIKAIYWLDGGHSGGSNTWMTNKPLLQVLAKSGIQVNIHVTPYQVHCDLRPWIGREEKIFRETLRKLGARIERTLHFIDEPRSLENHFRVLEIFCPTEI